MLSHGKGQPAKIENIAYEPSPRDYEIYAMLCEGFILKDVAERFGLGTTTIWDIRSKIEKYLAPILQKNIIAIKVRQTNALESLYRDNMQSWRDSRNGLPTDETLGENASIKRKPLGDVAYVDRAMAALDRIRAIWNVEKHFEQEGMSALNPAGIPRDEYRRRYYEAKIAEMQELVAELNHQDDSP